MHIGIDASRAFLKERTGTEEYSCQLIKALTSLDQRNKYTLYVRPFVKVNFPLPANFHLKPIPFPYLWTQVGLAWECLKNPPDVLFIPAHTLPAVRHPGLKSVVTIHDLGAEFLPQYHQFLHKTYLNKSTEYAVSHATHLIAVSQSTGHDLINKLYCDAEKISVIYEGYDRKNFKFQISNFKFQKIKKKYGITEDYILFVGTVQPRKNIVRLIEAFATLGPSGRALGASPNPYTLVIVGKPGWLFEEIYAAPEKFGVGEEVKFLDYVPVEDLPVLYRNALCLVLPSLYEGFGLPVLEAMACGCPVVVSKAGSLPELVGEAGLLVDPFKVGDMVRNLKLIIDNSELRETLIERGLTQVRKFSWEKCGRETLKVLENVGKRN